MAPGNRLVAKALAFSPAAFDGHPLRALVEVALRDLGREDSALAVAAGHYTKAVNLASAVGFADTGTAQGIALPCPHDRPNRLLPESVQVWSVRQQGPPCSVVRAMVRIPVRATIPL